MEEEAEQEGSGMSIPPANYMQCADGRERGEGGHGPAYRRARLICNDKSTNKILYCIVCSRFDMSEN